MEDSSAAQIAVAGINALGTSLGGVSSYKSAKKLMREQMAWQESMYDKQVATNRENWQLQNEYNSPSNQRALMEAAGYNPGFTNGDPSSVSSADNINGGDVPSAPSYSPIQNILGDSVSAATSAFATLVHADAEKQNAGSNAITAAASATNAETQRGYYNHLNALTREQIGIASQENAFKSEYLQQSINQIKAQTNFTTIQTGVARIIGEWLPTEKAMQLSQISAQIDNILQDTKNKKIYPKIASAQVSQLLANAKFLLSQQETNDALRSSQVKEANANASSAVFHKRNMMMGFSDTFESDKRLATVHVSADGSLNVYGSSFGASISVPRGMVMDGTQAILDLVQGLRSSK